MIKLTNIYKFFGKGNETVEVLKDISIEIQKGELVSITGSSGAGKSTLMHIMSGMEKPTYGTVLFNGINLYELSGKSLDQHRNQNIGFVFQFHYLLDDFTALENVMVPALLGGMNLSSAERKATALLTKIGLRERLTHLPKEMSGGEQQRTAVARALMNDPMVVFADEPTGNLDKHNSDIVENLLFSLKELGITVVLVTHDSDIAEKCDRNIYLEKA